ncbi:hypothetical protein SynA1528_01149 [Synechococcus sp. A15-28]|nr:hypothetical protein SynA1528_01149 [Synechococcus sp. A15-28]
MGFQRCLSSFVEADTGECECNDSACAGSIPAASCCKLVVFSLLL